MSQKSKTEGEPTSLVSSEHASTIRRLVRVFSRIENQERNQENEEAKAIRGAIFSSVDFILELMFVHRCERCCVYVKEMQLQGKTVFQGCNSVFVGN